QWRKCSCARLQAAQWRDKAAQGTSLGRVSRMIKPGRAERIMAYTVPKLTDFSPPALDAAVADLLTALEQESAQAGNSDQRKVFRDRWLARKDGILTQVNDLWLKAAPKDAKRDVGQRVNKLKTEVEQRVEATLAKTPNAGSEASLDISLPGIRRRIG